jgi:hypothetical protein
MLSELDLKQEKNDLLNEHFKTVIDNINLAFSNDRGFILRDLLEEGRNDQYYIYMTKGILLTLLAFDYIKIISTYNGNKNYVYLCKKQIKIENVNK